MIERSVPARSSLWSGTGTVIVESASRFCMTMWLPRCRTCSKPCWARILHTSAPDNLRSLANGNTYLGDEDFWLEASLDLSRRSGLKE